MSDEPTRPSREAVAAALRTTYPEHLRKSSDGQMLGDADAFLAALSPAAHRHGDQDCDPSEAAYIADELSDAICAVLAYWASPPEYPGLVLVPRRDLERLAALSTGDET